MKGPDDCIQCSMNLSAYQTRRRWHRNDDIVVDVYNWEGDEITEYSGGSAAVVATVLARDAATKRHGGKVKGARYFRRY